MEEHSPGSYLLLLNLLHLIRSMNKLEKRPKKNKLELFAGIDNAFDVTYNPSNDINATRGHYYAAPRPKSLWLSFFRIFYYSAIIFGVQTKTPALIPGFFKICDLKNF